MLRKPDWLRVRFNSSDVARVADILKNQHLNTVCHAANCPNMGECFHRRTATFLALGSSCTRNCRFCNIDCGRPAAPDPAEPEHIAEAAKALNLRHVVITQVTRDDLPDGGAAHMAAIVRTVRKALPEATIETLISDFGGSEDALSLVLDSGPAVLNHNMEMVRSLFPKVRPQGDYDRSLGVLRAARRLSPKTLIKTGFMLGLGETDEEVRTLMRDALAAGCDILTISQYLQPSPKHWPLARYAEPAEFERLKQEGLSMGYAVVESSPLVRSSYMAAEALDEVRRKRSC